ncbi:MAG: hypothetical protein CFE24_07820 [Flavobacterium sp. BFFFF2]|nr:MAG: hypothetical protein CFE24_07820 [Flavobacterium sp. BFFFF2]
MFDKEFKLALANLPDAEKDKLLVRLLRKDKDLANRLYFELVDHETVEQKREKMAAAIREKAVRAYDSYYSPGLLLMATRDISGDIAYHVKITKDKYGDVSLSMQLLIDTLTLHAERLASMRTSTGYKLFIYLINKTFKILLQIHSMDEDYRLDFKENLQTLGELIGNCPPLMRMCIQNGLDVIWLTRNEIPDDIVALHREIKDSGFLV